MARPTTASGWRQAAGHVCRGHQKQPWRVLALVVVLATCCSCADQDKKKPAVGIPSRLKAEHQRMSKAEPLPPGAKRDSDPSKIDIFIGVFTGASPATVKPGSRKDYAARRLAIRDTWYKEAMRYPNLLVQFVCGVNLRDPEGQKILEDEAKVVGDFLMLPVADSYEGLTNKSKHFFAAVWKAYPKVRWIIKADDDVYIKPKTLLMIGDQWDAMKVDYTSCMVHGNVHPDTMHRWYEPNWALYANQYAVRGLGTIYALSGRVVGNVIVRNFEHLRLSGSAEDAAVGLWLLSQDTVFFDDERLCAAVCRASAVAIYNKVLQGMSWQSMRLMHDRPQCTKESSWPPQYWWPQVSAWYFTRMMK